jgi:hypothetical protein
MMIDKLPPKKGHYSDTNGDHHEIIFPDEDRDKLNEIIDVVNRLDTELKATIATVCNHICVEEDTPKPEGQCEHHYVPYTATKSGGGIKEGWTCDKCWKDKPCTHKHPDGREEL